MTACEQLLVGGRFLTQDALQPVASALAVRDGRIVAVGSEAQARAALGVAPVIVHLGERVVVPGFVDAHAHLWKMGSLLCHMLDLRSVRSLTELSDTLRRFAPTTSPSQGEGSSWVLGRGFNEAAMAEGRMPTRHDLDAALPGRAVFLTRTCGHIAVASSVALRLAGVDAHTPDPAGGQIVRDADGQPTGVLNETAMGLVGEHAPPPGAADYARMITAAAEEALTLGITTMSDAGVTPEILAVYRDLDAAGKLPCRVQVMALRRPLGSTQVFELPEQYVSDFLRVDTVKILADGGLSGATAALRQSYRHDPCCRGILRTDRRELIELSRPAHEAGFHVAVHAIGDEAIDITLDAFEALGPGPTHRIEHFGLPDAAQIQRAARLRVGVAPQPIFIHSLGDNFRRYLPDDLLERAYPLRSMIEGGLVVAFSSDAPVVADHNPLLGIEAAVRRCDFHGAPLAAHEAVDVETALAAYTRGGAEISGDAVGVLAPGRLADLAVLSDDPTQVPAEDLAGIQVEATYLGGTLVYQRAS